MATLGFAQPAAAQTTIHVTTTLQGVTDSNNCSLQEAIYSAEFGTNIALNQTDPDTTYTTGCTPGTGAGDTIVLPGGVLQFGHLWDGDAHNPFGPTATPIIFKEIVIHGNGTTLQSVGGGHFRLFAVGFASFTVDGTAYSGTGNLTLQDVNVKGFQVKGGDGRQGGGGGLGAGGAIYAGKIPGSGVPALTIENSAFDGNGAIGGNGGGQGAAGGGGGLGGSGGHEAFNTRDGFSGGGGGGARGDGGSTTSEAGGGGGGTVFSGGDADVGGAGGYLCGGNGGGSGNDGDAGRCPGGGGGGGGLAFSFTGFGGDGNGGAGAYGGGGGGGAGDGGNGGFGGGGGGGGACLSGSCGGSGGFGGGGGNGTNSGGSFGGRGGDSTGGGGGALGGAVFNDSGTVAIRNSTFYNNSVTRGVGGGFNADNGGDSGGAIFSRNGSLTVQDATVSNNQATGAGGGIVVMNDGATPAFVLDNTIVANNGAHECITEGTITTTGSAANLIVNNSGCPNVTVTSDPQLGPFQLNSPGDTRTMAIQPGVSPAIDAGDDTTALATDQRGVTRPQGPHSDIGAYEAPPPSADIGLTKAVSSSTAQPGDTIVYTLTVTNHGPDAANNVSVTDTLPSALTFVSCSASGGGSCSFSGTALTATYATLVVNETETITIQETLNANAQDNLTVVNTADASASSPIDPDTSNNSASASFTVHNRADLAVTKRASATQVEVGDPVTYTITLTNNGPYDARSAVLSDTHPAGVTFNSCTSTVGTCHLSGGVASLNLASLTNGSAVAVTIHATVDFGVADGSTVTNTASVTSSTFDPATSNNSGDASFTVLNNSDLFVSQHATKLTNRQLKYTVSVQNLGRYLGKQLVLTDAIPSGTRFVSITPGAWSCSAPPAGSVGTISCTLNSLAVNATQSLTFVVKVTTPGNVLVNNTATVSAATFDPNTANNSATLTSKVGAGS